MVARRLGADPAVVTPAGTWSGRDLARYGAGAADWLDTLGARPGHSVPALLTTSLPATALLVGGAGSGRPLAPIGPRLATRELAACLARHDAPVVVTEPPFVDAATAAARQTGQRVAVAEDLTPSARALDWSPAPDAIVTVMHTSGTTGVPKLVPVLQDRLAARVRNSVPLTGLCASDVYATMTPFQHIGGIGNVLVTLATGAALVASPPFRADTWRDLAEVGVTAALLVPTMIEALLERGVLALPDLRMLQYGGSPIHPDTLATLVAQMPTVDLVQIYGTTEGSPVTCLTADDHRAIASGRRELATSVGRAAPGVEVLISEPGADGVGEVLARAAHVHVTGEDGYLHTGDLGHVDRDGYLYLAGRLGDRIVRGGENVEPLEVEYALAEHPAVLEAAVVGVPDRRLGEKVKAFVVPLDAAALDVDTLRGFARERLAGFKVPEAWELVDELPRNDTGKVLRRALRDRDEGGGRT
jgi:acyl-CoA synthetase (AMP-forming)/AMP-acid ligase II